MILVDTDICIELLRGNPSVINQRLKREETVAISFMTIGELFYGAQCSNKKEENFHLVEEFILSTIVINTDIAIMKIFGKLKANLRESGLILPDADILIASTALTKCSALVTGNTKHFERFENLQLQNWLN